jgi:hypothetical protein
MIKGPISSKPVESIHRACAPDEGRIARILPDPEKSSARDLNATEAARIPVRESRPRESGLFHAGTASPDPCRHPRRMGVDAARCVAPEALISWCEILRISA